MWMHLLLLAYKPRAHRQGRSRFYCECTCYYSHTNQGLTVREGLDSTVNAPVTTRIQTKGSPSGKASILLWMHLLLLAYKPRAHRQGWSWFYCECTCYYSHTNQGLTVREGLDSTVNAPVTTRIQTRGSPSGKVSILMWMHLLLLAYKPRAHRQGRSRFYCECTCYYSHTNQGLTVREGLDSNVNAPVTTRIQTKGSPSGKVSILLWMHLLLLAYKPRAHRQGWSWFYCECTCYYSHTNQGLTVREGLDSTVNAPVTTRIQTRGSPLGKVLILLWMHLLLLAYKPGAHRQGRSRFYCEYLRLPQLAPPPGHPRSSDRNECWTWKSNMCFLKGKFV